ncbi:MAG: hypothetical protein DSY55_04800 [Clostridia bacterium]|nr:MAG: hypothetical protein DSY55_04800 [Clostridia bacterium]
MSTLPTWLGTLEVGNQILSAAILILSFSLFVYVLTYNLHSRVGRAFAALLLGMIVVYSGDVVLPQVDWAENWLRLQWLGIAWVPAAYLHFTRSVLLAVWLRPDRFKWRWLVRSAYIASILFALLALFSNVLVQAPVGPALASNLRPGPLFPLFSLYFVVATLWGGWNLLVARAHVRTHSARRRLTYLLWSFAAPGLGVFPYLILASQAGQAPPALVLILASIANAAVGMMLVVMAYSVAYYGVFAPDRVVKRQLLYFILRGPTVAAIVIALIFIVPRVEAILGLPPDTALTFLVVMTIVLAQILIEVAQPWIDHFLYRNETEEIAWLHTLETRLMTSGDLSQFLENVLVTLCNVYDVDRGFVALPGEEEARLEAVIGDEQEARQSLTLPETQRLLRSTSPDSVFHRVDGYVVRSLINRHTDESMGILALHSTRLPENTVDEETADMIEHLVRRAEIAVEDRLLQLDVFEALRPILPEMDVMQALRGAVPYVISLNREDQADWVHQPEFYEWVRGALSHFWGGPKLSKSPLLKLRIVKRALSGHEQVPTQALREILQQAIERQRPPGDRQMTTSEWLLYNILDLKYLQGRKVREVARKLAISESDLYRKQRIAIAEVARTLAEMEAEASENQDVLPIEAQQNPDSA